MKTHFKTIKDFLSIKEYCVFCGSKLKPIFINFSRLGDVPRIKSEIDGDKFSFALTDITANHNLRVSIQIDMTNNMMNISPLPYDDVFDKHDGLIISAFENLGPHMELYCSKKKCKMKYCLTSTFFKCESGMPDEVPPGKVYRIKPFELLMESFSTPRLWVLNDWVGNRTNIYSRSNTDIDPIKTEMLDIEALGKDKVLTRIKTLVIFS